MIGAIDVELNEMVLFPIIYVLVMVFAAVGSAEAQHSGSKADAGYIENKGQMGDQYGQPNRDVRYLIVRPGLNIQLKGNSFSYDSYVVERSKRQHDSAERRMRELMPRESDRLNNDDSITYHYHRVDIELVGSNPCPVMEAKLPSEDYLNYYTHITEQTNGEQGATFVRGYASVTYKDIWPKIDLEWFIDEKSNPEYQFIIRPGADVSTIKMRYHGADSTELISDAIMIYVKHGPIKESIPRSYFATSQCETHVRFRELGTDLFGVDAPEHDVALMAKEPLVIDPKPERLWGTYLGGSGEDAILGCKMKADTIIAVGYSTSTTGIATAGAHQFAYSGGTRDGVISSLSGSGARVWTTYYGGSGRETCNAVEIVTSGENIIVGSTTSSTGIATDGSYQSIKSDTFDIFVLKMTSAGVRLWCSYFGGKGIDAPRGVSQIGTDEVLLAGLSGSDGLATNGAADTTRRSFDPILACFKMNGSRAWVTYVSPWDSNPYTYDAEDIDISNSVNGICCVVFSTRSKETYPDGTVQSYYTVWLNVDSTGRQLWLKYDQPASFIYPVATTRTNDGLNLVTYKTRSDKLATANAYCRYNDSQLSRAVVRCFDDQATELWSTYIPGSEKWVNGLQLASFQGGDFLIAVGSEIDSLVATSDAYQKQRSGWRDASLQLFSSNGAVKRWGTYYGGSDDESVESVLVSAPSLILVSGYTKSSNSISSAQGHQTTYSGGQDGFIALFRSCVSPSITSLSGGGSVCEGSTTTASVRAASGSTIRWTAPKLGVFTSGSLTDTLIRVRWNAAGLDTVRVRVINSTDTTCYKDTLLVITVNPQPKPVITGTSAACPQTLQTYRVMSSAGRRYQWLRPRLGSIVGDSTLDSVRIRWSSAGSDTLRMRETITASGCSKDTFLVVTVNQQPTPVITGSQAMCDGDEVAYSLGRVAGRSYQWTVSGRGSVVGAAALDNVRIRWTGSGKDTVRVRETIVATGCYKDTTLLVTVNPRPRPVITGSQTACTQSEYVYGFGNTTGMTNQWTVPSVAEIVSGSVNTPQVRLYWKQAGTYDLSVRTTVNATGCFADTVLQIRVTQTPRSDISGPSSLCLSDDRGKIYSISPGDPGTLYAWTITPSSYGTIITGQGTPQITVNWQRRGTATLRVSASSSACSRDSTITITVADSLTPSISSSAGLSFCQGDSVQLDAGSGYTTYAWYEGATQIGSSRYLVTTKAATYTVRVGDGSCSGTSAEVTTSINPLPTATITENPPGTLLASSDAQQAQYQWYDASTPVWTPIAAQTSSAFVPIVSGIYGVEITNTTTVCKQKSQPYTITIGPPPTDPVITSLTPTTTICAGQQAMLRVRVVGGRAPYLYAWSDGGTALTALEDTTLAYGPSSSTTVNCVVTDADDKSDTAQMSITVLPYPTATVIESPRGTLLASPQGARRYQWYTGTLTPIIGGTATTYQPPSSGRYYVEVDNQYCSDTSDGYDYQAPPQARIEVSDYDFGQMPVDDLINAAGGHIGSVRVRNLTGAYVELTGAGTSDPAVFTVPHQWPRRMHDGDTAQITVRFKPTEKRQYQTTINVANTAQTPATGSITGTGRDLLPDERVTQVVLSPVRDEVNPGDTISVLLRVSIERPELTAGQPGRFMAAIQWDSRVLDPLPTPGMLYDTSGTYAIAQVGNGYRQPKQSQLYRFRFRAKQSEVDTTSIIFSGAQGFVWQDDRKAYPALVDSLVRVRVCQDGGAQLVGRTVPARFISITPNPARDKITVTYVTASAATLDVMTMDGRLIRQLPLRADQRSVDIDATDLSRGTYMLVIGSHRQPSATATVIVE